jgi:hypothetical protein
MGMSSEVEGFVDDREMVEALALEGRESMATCMRGEGTPADPPVDAIRDLIAVLEGYASFPWALMGAVGNTGCVGDGETDEMYRAAEIALKRWEDKHPGLVVP